MNHSYLKKHFATHSVSYVALVWAYLSFLVIGFVLTPIALYGFFTKVIFAVISESRAPVTFQIFCNVALIYLSAKVALTGPLNGKRTFFDKVFGVYLPNSALSIGATFVGVTTGAALAVAIFFPNSLPPTHTIVDLLKTCLWLSAGLVMLYVFFVLISVNKSTAPGYNTPSFPIVMRVLSGLFCIALVGRSVVLLASEL